MSEQKSVEQRRLEIMENRLTSLISGYEQAMANFQLDRELLIQGFEQQKAEWEEEKKVLLDKISGMQDTKKKNSTG